METEYKHYTEEINKATDFFQTLLNKYNQEKIISLSQKEEITELYKQLEDKYSTETHLLVSRETLDGFIEKFEELGSELSNLDGLLEDINSCAGSISDDSGYNDARAYQSYAREYADEVRNLLTPETEEVE